MPLLNPIDREALRHHFQTSEPFPFFMIDGFLEESFAREVAAAYPNYDEARKLGREFSAVNERLKVQLCDAARFPAPVRKVHELLASPEFMSDLSYITGIDRLVADDLLAGGGMHVTGSGGRLDVHVDFNFLEERKLHRRLNILLYLNEGWDETWGGNVELWDAEVKQRHHSFAPLFNRCVVFATSEFSYHGVTPVTCPPGVTRRSFAAYYYTREAPPAWDGSTHSTVFRARPHEVIRGRILMPAQELRDRIIEGKNGAKRHIKRLIERASGR
jgi:Rps23 Pro-64 3,4-dihydroxylase Tpa1-like proline 4-hydroxylase